MILKLDAGTAVIGYMMFVLTFLVCLWWFSSHRRKSSLNESMTNSVCRCHYCGHIFLEQNDQQVKKCPLCASYLEVADAS